jgi:hypothetical protein
MRKSDKWNPFGDPQSEQEKLDKDRVRKRKRYVKKGTTSDNKNFHLKKPSL